MPEQVKIERCKDFIAVHVVGDPLSPQEIESALLAAVAQAIEFDLNIIIQREMPVKQRASTVDFYYYADSLRKLEFKGKLALVFPKEMHRDNLKFFESAARNRGVNLVLFSSQADAVDWVVDQGGGAA
jgi:hypothetical protein